MNYFETIREITKSIPTSIVDFSIQRERTSPPTQASSNFITNKEQGDWAELLIFKAINETFEGFVAVRYGKSDDLVAGEEGFDVFYNEFQNELDTIGKRPDLLVFREDDFRKDLGHDVSKLEHSRIEDYVRLAIAGLEIRSSAFLIDSYEAYMDERTRSNMQKALNIKEKLLTEYSDILEHPKRRRYKDILHGINEETIHAIQYRSPGWSSSERLQEVRLLFRSLKEAIKMVQKRDFLSITPKVEDLKVVYRWVEKFNVPHFYFQVFFDKVYGVAFQEILNLITDSDKEGEYYEIGGDVKNQNKMTIKINTKKTHLVANKVEEPEHKSVRREMGRGRLLFYVSFDKGTASLDVDGIKRLLNIQNAQR